MPKNLPDDAEKWWYYSEVHVVGVSKEVDRGNNWYAGQDGGKKGKKGKTKSTLKLEFFGGQVSCPRV